MKWHDTAQARRLVNAIIAERPDYFVRSSDWSAWGVRRYDGDNARKLRALYDRAYERAMIRANLEHEAGWTWTEARNDALEFLNPDADTLIEQRLYDAETERLLRFTMELQAKRRAA